jgi:hypothetical protein
MRKAVAGAVVSSCIVVCIACGGSGGSAPGTNSDAGPTGTSSGATPGTGSDAGPGNSSTTGPIAGCPAAGSVYTFHWTYVSGGTLCEQEVPPDSTNDIDAGLATDAGCPATISGCNYSQTCPLTLGDADTGQLTENVTVAADGSLSGTLLVTGSVFVGGATLMESCVYSLAGTKQ